MSNNPGYDEATESLREEYETPEQGDGAETDPAPAPQMVTAIAESVDTDAVDAEVYAQVLDYAEDVVEDLAGEDYVDPETLQNEFRDAVSDLVGEANDAIATIESDRNAYNRAADELAEGLYAAATVAEELGQGYAALGDAVDFTHNQVIRNPNPTFGGSGDNRQTVEDIQKFTEEITGEDPTLGLLGSNDSTDSTHSRNSSNRSDSGISGTGNNPGRRNSGSASDPDVIETDEIRAGRVTADESEVGTQNVEEQNVTEQNLPEDESSHNWYDPRGWF